jgi:uncharacterized protein (TIGR03437 family)
MRQAHFVKSFVFLFLASAGFAAAQVSIGAVVNAGSRIQSTSSFYGIAQGALFAITGKGLGPDPLQQATFPLPTTDGLGGVTVQANIGGTAVDCILVYVSSTEVGAILPSNTPLGTGTVTLNNNGVTATKAITVVASAFGIFTSTVEGYAGRAMAFNVSAADGSTAPNSISQSVQPEQDVLINGTGLGAITSDETQNGVTDVPATTVQVYVGVMPATVVSAGRGLCCDGLDPSFPAPQGIAAWDVIRFTIPDGVTGCFIPVVVQIGNLVSNLATLSIDPSGAACTLLPSSTLPPALTQQLAGKQNGTLGSIALGREIGMSVPSTGPMAGTIRTAKTDTGSAVFGPTNSPPSMIAPIGIFSVNSCTINSFPDPNGNIIHNGTVVAPPPEPVQPESLDAGPALTVKGPSGTRTITDIKALGLDYYKGVTFGDTAPGNFFDPGHYTVTGPGGKGVGPFMASIDVPSAPFVWTNIPSVLTPLDRSKDLTIKWTGGIPNTQVTAVGGSAPSAFLCAADVSAGQLTIPSYVLLNLPPSGPPLNFGQLTLGNRTVNLFTASGLDIAWVGYAATYTLSLKYQ